MVRLLFFFIHLKINKLYFRYFSAKIRVDLQPTCGAIGVDTYRPALGGGGDRCTRLWPDLSRYPDLPKYPDRLRTQTAYVSGPAEAPKSA